MPTFSQVQLQRGQRKSFEQIGDQFGVTRQRAHAIFTGYQKAYRKTEKYKAYKRHYESHLIGSKPRIYCKFCEEK